MTRRQLVKMAVSDDVVADQDALDACSSRGYDEIAERTDVTNQRPWEALVY